AHVINPKLEGPENYTNLVVCWGSTYHAVKEALEAGNLSGTALLHYSQVWPVHSDTIEILKKADKIVSVENNATAQFSRIITRETGIIIQDRVLKYDGLPFCPSQLNKELKRILG
ncbi:2-oxoacid:acceptor oxidoreductase subunit alpha, partial [Candidatus Woesearchaeota archaeon]